MASTGRTPPAQPAHGTRRPHHVTLLAYDGIQGLDLVGPLEVFSGANAVLQHRSPDRPRDETHYQTTVVSAHGGPIDTESHLSINTVAAHTIEAVDTLVIPGGLAAPDAADDADVVAATRSLAADAGRVMTVCTGTFIAAAAGLLDGTRVSTHWARADALRQRFPDLDVDTDPIFVHDGRVWSSAGVTAGIDLTLAVVEHDHGPDVAQVVARWLVMFLRRPGGQTQFATAVWTERADAGPIRTAQDLIDASPDDDHRVALLAARVGMSERHFIRRFTDEVGLSPARYVAAVRIEAAKRALETSTLSVDVIARQCGFGSAETMRRTFARRLGASPDQYRQRFRVAT